MSDIGRNAPCPCGSGKKYKQCHLQRQEAPRRHSAGAASLRMTNDIYRAMTAEEHADAFELFAFEPEGALPRPIADREAEASLFVPWAVYVYPGADGLTAAARYRRRHGARLGPVERELLDAEAATPLSVWEAVEVRREVGFVARDLFTHRELFVRDVAASRCLTPRSCLLGRVVDVSGEGMLSGNHPVTLGPVDGDRVVKGVLKLLRRRKLPLPADVLWRPLVMPALLTAWRLVQLRPPPMLQNTDGDPVEPTTHRFRFDPGDRAAIVERLAAEPMMEREDGGAEETSLTFRVPGNAMHASWDNTVVGTAVVGEKELVLETNSRRRGEALRATVERLCGGRLRFVGAETKDTAQMLEELRARGPGPAVAAVPPPELVEAVRSAKAAHYRAWVDQSLPALGGKTPREAARTAAGRQKIDAILREIEFHEARHRPHERFDVATLRAALGMV